MQRSRTSEMNNIQARCEQHLGLEAPSRSAETSEQTPNSELRLGDEEPRGVVPLFTRLEAGEDPLTCIHSLTVSSEGVQPFSG